MMIEKIRTENYKSLLDVELDLGRINVFIGANGSGKSNILEAVAMLASERVIKMKDLSDKGVRIAKPSLTFSSFLGKKSEEEIKGYIQFDDKKERESVITNEDSKDIYADWYHKRTYKNNGKVELILDPRWPQPGPFPIGEGTGKERASRRVLEENFMNFERKYLSGYLIYSLWTNALRGITNSSTVTPLGINGEGLDLLLSTFDTHEMEQLKYFGKKCISWIDDFFYDEGEILKRQGYKLGRSTSNLYFQDKYMQKKENVFSAENANEGALHLLFYLALFISKKTPAFFAVDNIETGMNPELCRFLIKYLCELSQANNKQALITTHNPAILNGLNLHDDNQRLFVVTRRDDGQTRVERIRLKPNIEGQEKVMLSELWIRGFLGGVPDNF